MRRPWLDGLRWQTVLLVLVYHVGYLFNGVGVPGGIGPDKALPAADVLLSLVYPWFMVLLFAVAGICARYALEREKPSRFLRERARKLLVPSLLGPFVYHWVTGWMNVSIGGGLEYIPPLIRYPVFVLAGQGPLWFCHVLFLWSLAAALLKRLDRVDRLHALCGRLPGPALFLLGFVLWGGAQIGNVPVITVYRFGIYGAAFLMGYLFLSHDGAQEAVKRYRWPALIAALLLGVTFAARFYGQNFADDAILRSAHANWFAWTAALAALGWGKHSLKNSSPFARYMTGASFGWYVVHYPAALALCWGLYASPLPGWACYLLGLLGVFPLTAALYELIRRIPVLRFLVLGIKKPQKA